MFNLRVDLIGHPQMLIRLGYSPEGPATPHRATPRRTAYRLLDRTWTDRPAPHRTAPAKALPDVGERRRDGGPGVF
ncbi:hypothetical protein PV416_12695 [Streptomyces ipomoeae]|uniref:hypothetical protein n=1 Tax=Streptomyces ipomoeae TaxID=103232 RepID=UPI001146737B|nr:hypothetical protein [Streptomyces ipomoeae]MDX2821935.1 hypothetical protein [Streptomyces ipomoeae]MDX2874644.1 hypothetical protein [Streptomyces ipomoeae]TQE17641.1 hypothetical protein Sipo7851_47420 [Streptomyces ipomoeae]